MDKDEERLNKLRKRAKKIANNLKEFIPEISGAAIGAAFGNPIVGAVIGTTAKKLLDVFMKAKLKPSDLDDAIKQNIERFSQATLVSYGTMQKIKKEDEMYHYNTKDIDNSCCSVSPEYVAHMYKTTRTR